jgi:hypothetical protein
VEKVTKKGRTGHGHTFMVTNFHNHKNEPSLKGSQSCSLAWQTPSFMETQRVPRLKDPVTVLFPKSASLIWTKPPSPAAGYSFNL